jgi:multidrug efflux pump subunit AcrA (membrane-fusion protein)
MKNNSNLWRAIIGLIIGIVIIYAAVKFAQKLINEKSKPEIRIEKQINKVYTQIVINETVPVSIQEKGSLQALRKVELYSEVQGILEEGERLFKAGQTYGKGRVLFSINDDEFRASLISQKSVLYNLITQAMPDLKLDYPDVFGKWQSYLDGFDIQKPTPVLPSFDNDREKYFINSRNIVTSYYNIKNLEEKHKKYIIRSPFYGIVTESLVNPGTLVRPGQKLGSILSPTVYELPVSVNESYKDYLQIGKEVTLYNLDHSKSWTGKIARIDATINTTTQGIQIFIQVRGKELKEGMFLEANIEGKSIANGFEISRKLLVENSKTYSIVNNALKLVDLDIAFFKEKSAVVTNLVDSTIILQNPIPGAYEGMLVENVDTSN